MQHSEKNKINIYQIAIPLALLANPVRFHVLSLIGRRERTVKEMAMIIGISQSALSQHLTKLKVSGMVKVRCEAQRRYYSLKTRSTYDFVQEISALVGKQMLPSNFDHPSALYEDIIDISESGT